MKNIVILISGTGSNMAAIVQTARQQKWSERLGARVAAVISNRPDAKGLLFAREQGIATAVVDHTAHASREAFDTALAQAVDAHQPALVVLAGSSTPWAASCSLTLVASIRRYSAVKSGPR